MEFVTCDPLPALELVPISDVHVGSRSAAVDQFQALLADLPHHPHRRMVLLGDLGNYALKDSRSNCYEDPLHPQDELDLLLRWLRPVKDRISGLVPGNHEERIFRSAGIDISRILAEAFGVPYGEATLVLRVPVGSVTYTICCHHGTGGDRTTSRFEGNHRLAQIVDAAVYISDHIHSFHVAREAHYHTDGELRLHEQVFVTTAGWAGYEVYAERMALKPGIVRTTHLHFCPDRRKIEVRC